MEREATEVWAEDQRVGVQVQSLVGIHSRMPAVELLVGEWPSIKMGATDAVRLGTWLISAAAGAMGDAALIKVLMAGEPASAWGDPQNESMQACLIALRALREERKRFEDGNA